MKQQTVTINGVVYDSQTGKPLHVTRGRDFAARHSAHTVHAQPQRSKTLNRRYVKKQPAATQSEHAVTVVHHARASETKPETPVLRSKPNHAFSVHRAPAISDVKRSDKISRFTTSSHQQPAPHHVTHDTQPIAHPVVQKAEARRTAAQPVERVVKPSHVIKREAIEHATAKMPAKHARHNATRHKKPRAKIGRLLSIGSASLAVLLLGAYFTYLNMPALSTRVAATQAGIEATYPSYQPMGYSLDGPVAYKEGSVSMKFAANGGPESYTLSQSKSGWDSSAVLENYVKPTAGSSYTTTAANGLTIYTYGNNSVWVNNGILYNITGSAVLSSGQIQRIATSL
jgi:hypothetical protein